MSTCAGATDAGMQPRGSARRSAAARWIEAFLRLDLRPLDEVPYLRHGAVRRSRFLWRRLLPLVESRACERLAALLVRRLVHAVGRPSSPGALQRLLDRTTPQQRARLAQRLLYHRGLRLLRRFDRYLEARQRRTAFVSLGMVTVSIGGDCNLRCAGCLTTEQRTPEPVSAARLAAILSQARRAGAGVVTLAGPGEPFLDRREAIQLLETIARHRLLDIVLFTNGSRVDDWLARRIAAIPNLLVLVSIDGLRATHDRRRGRGSFERATRALRLLSASQALCGFSTTVHAGNWEEVTSLDFVERLAAIGGQIGVYSEMLAIEPRAAWAAPLDPVTQAAYRRRVATVASASSLILLEARSLEENRYGCRAKKGTSCHIDATSGRVSPCALFPHSSAACSIDLYPGRDGLLDILRGPFFTHYRAVASRTHCSRDFESELAHLAANPHLGERDRAEVTARIERLRRPTPGATETGSCPATLVR